MTLIVMALATELSSAQKWAVSTNLADYAALATVNLDASAAVHKNFSIGAGVAYNPFSWREGRDDQFQLRRLDVEVQARWWPWYVYSGWWMSAKLKYRCYNYGGIVSSQTEEGDAVGLGAAAGYSLMLGAHLNVDFGVGFWTGWRWYTVYDCPRCGMTSDAGSKGFVMPENLIISLSYVF